MKYTQLWIVCLLAQPMIAMCAGLSEPVIRSGLGQRFIAEVDIVDLDKTLWKSVNAVVGSPALYEQYEVDYSPAVSDMEVLVLRHRNGRPYLRIVGHHPINDAFVELILDVGWKDGRVVRKYTILPEPPVNDPTQQEGYDGRTLVEREERKEARFRQRKLESADQMLGTAELIRRTESPDERVPNDQVTSKQANADKEGGDATSKAGKRWHVKRGDTLNRIAQQWDMPRLGMYQRMLALYRENPSLFKGGHPDRLIRGRWMIMPEKVEQLPESEQAAREDWQALMQSPQAWRARSLAEAEETLSGMESSVEKEAHRIKGENGQWKSDSEEASIRTDRLKVSRGMSAKDVENYERLLAIENTIRELIQEVRGRSPQLKMSTELKPLDGALPGSSESKIEVPPLHDEPKSAASENTASKEESVPVSSLQSSSSEASKPVKKRRSTRIQVPISAPIISPEEPNKGLPAWLQWLTALGFIGAVVSAHYLWKRRLARQAAVNSLLKESAELADASTIFTDTGQTIQQAVTPADLAGAGSLTRESLMNVDTDMQVDPLTEADVYISYERYEAAEALLRNALEYHPDSRDILWRLLIVSQALNHEGESKILAARLHSMFESTDPKQNTICALLGIPVNSSYAPVEPEPIAEATGAIEEMHDISFDEISNETPLAAAISLEKSPAFVSSYSDVGTIEPMMPLLDIPGLAELSDAIEAKTLADLTESIQIPLSSHGEVIDETVLLSTMKESNLLDIPLNLEKNDSYLIENKVKESYDVPPLSFDSTFDLGGFNLSDSLLSHVPESIPDSLEGLSDISDVVVSQDEHKIEDDPVQSQLELVKAWALDGKEAAARALLEAIIQTGTPLQQERARVMLDELFSIS